jgi:hypothetical protein
MKWSPRRIGNNYCCPSALCPVGRELSVCIEADFVVVDGPSSDLPGFGFEMMVNVVGIAIANVMGVVNFAETVAVVGMLQLLLLKL